MNEDLTRKRDAAAAAIGFGNLEETKLHNRTTEGETERHNRAVESLDAQKTAETERANRAREAQLALQLQESTRHSLATEAIQRQEADTKRLQAEETVRHNIAGEAETHRANVTKEKETERANRAAQAEIERHNLSTESIGRSQISLGYSELASLDRYRSSQLSLEGARVAETTRHNVAAEQEATRASQAREGETRRHNVVSESISRGQVQETTRRDKAQETLGWFNAGVNAAGTAGSILRSMGSLTQGGRFR